MNHDPDRYILQRVLHAQVSTLFTVIPNAAESDVRRMVSPDTAVRAVQAGDRERPQKYMGNPQYQPLAISQCAVIRLPSSKVHQQTCDSMCVGPPDANKARTVTVIDENLIHRLSERTGKLHSISVQVIFLCSLQLLFFSVSGRIQGGCTRWWDLQTAF